MRNETILVLLLLAACDERGRTSAPVSRARPRVVSLHDVTTDLVVQLGAIDRLVGIDEPVDPSSAVAAAVANVPRVASLETILDAHPDVVLGMHSLASEDPTLLKSLEQAGVDVYLAHPSTLEDVYAVTRAVAEYVDAEAAGEKLTNQLRFKAAANTPARERPLRVFVYDCCDPPLTAGRGAVLTDLVARAGGQNIFADVDADWPHVSWEEAISRKPELVVIHSYKYEGQGDVPDKLAALRAIPSLGRLPTMVLPLGCSLGGLRSIEGLQKLRAAIRDRS